jgi:hypothetical protein
MSTPPHKDTLPVTLQSASTRVHTLPRSPRLPAGCSPAQDKSPVRFLIKIFNQLSGLPQTVTTLHLFSRPPTGPQLGPPPAAMSTTPWRCCFTFGIPGSPHTADCQRPKQITNFAQDSICALTLPTYGVTHRSCAGLRPPSSAGIALLQLQANLPRRVVRDIRSSSSDLSALKKAVSRCRGATAADSPPSAAACRR